MTRTAATEIDVTGRSIAHQFSENVYGARFAIENEYSLPYCARRHLLASGDWLAHALILAYWRGHADASMLLRRADFCRASVQG
jgi:hypothetical protein